ncbi:MAG TPA: oligosaccharide flippase family protein, partial [Geobacterales bacterium]|nr:oligosaccharide flippase family protein [Geobacterales bacterium]
MSIENSSKENIGGALRSSSLVMIQFVVLNLAGIAYIATAARFLSKYDMGLLLVASVIVNLFTTLFSLAFNYTASKYIADLLSGNRKDIAISLAKLIAILGLCCSLVSLGIGYLVTYLVLMPFSIPSMYTLLVTLDGAINSLLFFFYGILFGFFEFKKGVLAFSFASGSRYLLSMIAILLGYGVVDVLELWVLGDFLGLLLFIIFSKDIIISKSVFNKQVFSLLKDSIKFSFPLYISSIISYVYLYIDRYLILYNVGLSNYALYGTAITASLILMNLPQLITNALLPYFSYTLSENKSEFTLMVSSTIRIICTTLAPFLIALAMLSEPIMYIFAGPKYLDGWFIFFIVTLAIGITFPVASLTSALLALNKSNVVLYANIVSIIIGAIVTQVLYEFYGINGAAMGRALLFVVSFLFISSWFYLRERDAYNISFHIKTSLTSIFIFSPLILFDIFAIKLNIYMIIFLLVVSSLFYIYILTRYKLLNESDIQNLSLIFPDFIGNYVYKLLSRILKPKRVKQLPFNQNLRY